MIVYNNNNKTATAATNISITAALAATGGSSGATSANLYHFTISVLLHSYPTLPFLLLSSLSLSLSISLSLSPFIFIIILRASEFSFSFPYLFLLFLSLLQRLTDWLVHMHIDTHHLSTILSFFFILCFSTTVHLSL